MSLVVCSYRICLCGHLLLFFYIYPPLHLDSITPISNHRSSPQYYFSTSYPWDFHKPPAPPPSPPPEPWTFFDRPVPPVLFLPEDAQPWTFYERQVPEEEDMMPWDFYVRDKGADLERPPSPALEEAARMLAIEGTTARGPLPPELCPHDNVPAVGVVSA